MSSGPHRRPEGRAVRRWIAGGGGALALLALADWLLLKTRAVDHPPWVLGAVVSALVLVLVILLAAAAVDLAGRKRRLGRGAGRVLLLGGLVALLLGGLLNWLLGIQGYVILLEGEAVPLHGGGHLQRFEGSPLARIGDLHHVLLLREVALVRSEQGRVEAESRLAVQRGEEKPTELTLRSDASGSAGSLRFHQGAFGFAPRVVILRRGETVLDRVVPFTSRRSGPEGITFEGLFTIEREGLEVEGAVDLASLDEGLRGHATLRLTVRRHGTVLGRGSLLPGHFAEIEEGYRIGFAGLERWSEIDVSRRTYGGVVLAGAGVALIGGVLWPLAAWRGF